MQNSAPAVAPSGLITSLAWTFIFCAALGIGSGLLQLVMAGLIFPMEDLRYALGEAKKTLPLPGFFWFVFEHLQWFAAASVALSMLTLVASIALLKRKNWARIFFIVMMILGVVGNLAGAVLPYWIVSLMPPLDASMPAEMRQGFDLFLKAIIAVMIIISITFAVLFGWVAKALMSERVRNEFSS